MRRYRRTLTYLLTYLLITARPMHSPPFRPHSRMKANRPHRHSTPSLDVRFKPRDNATDRSASINSTAPHSPVADGRALKDRPPSSGTKCPLAQAMPGLRPHGPGRAGRAGPRRRKKILQSIRYRLYEVLIRVRRVLRPTQHILETRSTRSK